MEVAAFFIGFVVHILSFSAAFVGNVPILVSVFGIRAASASYFGWRSLNKAHRHAPWIPFLLLECGPLLMTLWAAFNYSQTGQVGFNPGYWILPVLVDFLLWLFGRWLAHRYVVVDP